MPGKRMYGHDYTRPGFYMVTILTAGRRRLFGSCRDDRTVLSEAGQVVQRRWGELASQRPAVDPRELIVMPDHIHGILYVKEKLDKPVGSVLRGFKSGVTSELRKRLSDPSLAVWEKNYHDRVIMNPDTLRAERYYLHDNPRRYCVRRAHPKLFVRVNQLNSPRLPPGRQWAGFGNFRLLEKPAMHPVQVSRKVTPDALAVQTREALELAWRGVVMVSPFISPGEKAIAEALMAQEYGSLILIKADGFGPLYKPSGAYFDLCAQGRLLVLSPFAYTGRKQPLTRERCLAMNGWVARMVASNGHPQ